MQYAVEQFDATPVPNQELNIWQKTSDSTHGIVTPGNAIDAAALPLAVASLPHLDNWLGIAGSAIAFMADVVDGRAARATGTQSDLGEVVDATGDKVKMALALRAIWKADLAPRPLMVAVGIRNGVNAILTGLDRLNNAEPAIHPSKIGRIAIFAEQFGVGLHVIGSKLENRRPETASTLKAAGNVIGWSGVGLGLFATSGYTRKYIESCKPVLT